MACDEYLLKPYKLRKRVEKKLKIAKKKLSEARNIVVTVNKERASELSQRIEFAAKEVQEALDIVHSIE